MSRDCTDFDMQSGALEAAAAGKVHVVDTKTSKVKAYQVKRDDNTATVSEARVNQQVADAAAKAVAAVQLTNRIVTKPIDFEMIQPYMSNSQINTAYQLAACSYIRHVVLMALTKLLQQKALTNILPGSLSTELVYAATAPIERPFPITRVVTLVFPNGTSYKFRLRGMQAVEAERSTDIEPVISSEQDGILHIPPELDDQAYEGSGSSEAIDRTVLFMRTQGIEISAVPGGTSVTCSFFEKPLTCAVQK